MLEIDQRYQDPETNLSKHSRMKVEHWSKVLCQVNQSLVWKRNRNLYTMLLLNQIVTFGKLDKPFIGKPPDNGSQLQNLSKTEVNSKLSAKFKQITGSF